MLNMAKRKKSGNEITIWKFGCNWGGRKNPSFYEFIKSENVVIGRERCRYKEGDLVLITEGFTVKAIAKVNEEPQPITTKLSFRILSENYNVDGNEQTIFAKAEWCELSEDEIFIYPVQRGAVEVRQDKIKNKAVELWNKRKK